MRSAIRKNFGRPVAIIDGSDGTARQLKRQLEAKDLLRPGTEPGKVTFLNSDPSKIPMSQALFDMEY